MNIKLLLILLVFNICMIAMNSNGKLDLVVGKVLCYRKKTLSNQLKTMNRKDIENSKVWGAFVALKKKLPAHGFPSDLIVEVGDYLIHEGQLYTAKERMNIGMELAAQFPCCRENILRYLITMASQGESPVSFAQKYGYQNLITELNLYGGNQWVEREVFNTILKKHVSFIDRFFDFNDILKHSKVLSWYAIYNHIANKLAFWSNQSIVLNLLLDCIEHGMDPNSVDYQGQTMFHLLSYTSVRLEDMVIALVKKRANINAQTYEGNTPLHLAVERSYYGCRSIGPHYQTFCCDCSRCWHLCTLLLQHGADPTIKNQEGKTPLDVLSNQPWYQAVMKMTQLQNSTNSE